MYKSCRKLLVKKTLIVDPGLRCKHKGIWYKEYNKQSKATKLLSVEGLEREVKVGRQNRVFGG